MHDQRVFFLEGFLQEIEEIKVGEHQYILVVDDDERVLFVLSQALRALEDGYRVETARNGEEALRKARAKRYDILITDIVMSGMNGVEMTEAIRELYPDTVVIWITAHSSHRFQSDSERLKVYRYLEKPIEIGEIRQVVVDAAEQVKS